MAGREKILITLMIIAVLYGAFEVLRPEGNGTERQSPEANIRSAREIAKQISMQIKQAELTPAQIHILRLAAQKWESDPFYRLPEKSVRIESAGTGSKGAKGLKYTGYLEVGNIKMAIINGIEYRAGERLEQGEAVVQSISAQRVVLKSTDTGEQIIVHYKK
ncbi:MAG: hypothetical protein K9J85_00080 [Desulfobacteraceae bacterium]|nr:hypothetical protein [Desulfobacteraceae bacterium]